MVGNKIKDQLEPMLMNSIEQPVEICKRAENWINAAVIGNVIAKICHGRWIDWCDPQGVYAELDKIIETGKDAGQVPNTVIVRILKRSGIYFIDNSALPPFRCLHLMIGASFSLARPNS
jgi:hypothetical protein